jgi:hypothetical protein
MAWKLKVRLLLPPLVDVKNKSTGEEQRAEPVGPVALVVRC